MVSWTFLFFLLNLDLFKFTFISIRTFSMFFNVKTPFLCLR